MAFETDWKPFAEPWRTTAVRNGTIAAAIGLGVGLYTSQFAAGFLASVLALWFTLGGHVLEVLFRNRLRPRIGGGAPVHAVTRLVYWFGGGSLLYAGALTTRAILTGRGAVPWPWWAGGVAFVGLELVVHLLLLARGQPSFYNGRG
jgi:hypothetical protein